MSDNAAEPSDVGTAAPEHGGEVAVASAKSRAAAAVLCLLLGCLGGHRFYVGKVVTGVLILVTFGGFFGVWPVVDLVVILLGRFRDKAGDRLTVW